MTTTYHQLHEEYERIAEENAIKRKLLQQGIDKEYYKSNIAKETVSAAYEANVLVESTRSGAFES